MIVAHPPIHFGHLRGPNSTIQITATGNPPYINRKGILLKKVYIYIYIQGYSRFLFQHYNAVIATEPNLTYYTLSVICSNSAWNSTPTVGIEKIAHKLPENRIEL